MRRFINKHVYVKGFLTAVVLFSSVLVPSLQQPSVAYAATGNITCPDGSSVPQDKPCPPISDKAATGGNCSNVNTGGCDLLSKYINPLVNFLAALVGVAVVISIVVGGIQYGSSAGDPQKVTAAKMRIRNSIIALITFVFLYALLNFLIPGGVL